MNKCNVTGIKQKRYWTKYYTREMIQAIDLLTFKSRNQPTF